ncbi:MAG: hypothetical protein GY898_10240 [Proteobacteria bacterium]|nr:hypothetical protein [Pseudomonadota bacterium]
MQAEVLSVPYEIPLAGVSVCSLTSHTACATTDEDGFFEINVQPEEREGGLEVIALAMHRHGLHPTLMARQAPADGSFLTLHAMSNYIVQANADHLGIDLDPNTGHALLSVDSRWLGAEGLVLDGEDLKDAIYTNDDGDFDRAQKAMSADGLVVSPNLAPGEHSLEVLDQGRARPCGSIWGVPDAGAGAAAWIEPGYVTVLEMVCL